MLETVSINSRKKLDRIVSGLKAQGRHPHYTELWDERCRVTFVLYYCTNTFNPRYCPKRCNVRGYKSLSDLAKEIMEERGL